MKIVTKVIMDSGKEYIFDEHPEDFIKRFYDDKKGIFKHGLIHGNKFSINTEHISSIEDVDAKNITKGTEFNDVIYK